MTCVHGCFAEPWWLTTVFWLAGRLAITAALAVLLLYTTEIYPTEIRNSGLGIASTCGGIGSILAPYTLYLVSYRL